MVPDGRRRVRDPGRGTALERVAAITVFENSEIRHHCACIKHRYGFQRNADLICVWDRRASEVRPDKQPVSPQPTRLRREDCGSTADGEDRTRLESRS